MEPYPYQKPGCGNEIGNPRRQGINTKKFRSQHVLSQHRPNQTVCGNPGNTNLKEVQKLKLCFPGKEGSTICVLHPSTDFLEMVLSNTSCSLGHVESYLPGRFKQLSL